MSLRKGDVVVYSFAVARNTSEDIAHCFAEGEFRYFGVGARLRKADEPESRLEVGLFDLRDLNRRLPEPRAAEEALRHNCCAITTTNAQHIARAAAGSLHEHSQKQLSQILMKTKFLTKIGTMECLAS